MQISVLSALTVYHDGQFWVELAEHVEGGRYGVARIVFGAEPSDEEILRFVTSEWEKLSFFGDKATETSKPAKNPKRCAREAAKALKRPAVTSDCEKNQLPWRCFSASTVRRGVHKQRVLPRRSGAVCKNERTRREQSA
ncbi:MAG: YjdF family protein [Atopobiaceae bacterium]|nr:YjdF family protein [Atopobiaceae bacterium]